MIQKTQGIVLRVIPYNDKNKIVKIYTQGFGLLTFMVSAGNSKINRQKTALLQPLQPILLEVKPSSSSGIARLGEINTLFVLNSCVQHYYKRLILLFLNEVLYKCLKAEEEDNLLFNFLIDSLTALEKLTTGIGNFPLVFLCQLTKYLGCAPNNNIDSKNPFFNPHEGYFQPFETLHKLYDKHDSELLSKLLELDYQNINELLLNSSQRKNMLHLLMKYYAIHLPSFHDIQSLSVLEELDA
jgi:DNA repair protein RecO (recombination protein O)